MQRPSAVQRPSAARGGLPSLPLRSRDAARPRLRVAATNSSSGSFDEDGRQESGLLRPKVVAAAGMVGGLVVLAGGSLLLRNQISDFISHFTTLVDQWGPFGYLAYGVTYAVLEILALPAIPLTMTAGACFSFWPGLATVSISATAASVAAFLIARYVARDRVLQYAKSHPRFAAIDRAIGKDGLRVVLLLRLSPLLPLAASNYLYGLTSVDLGSYVLGSWLGMLPGTAAYVAAGTYGKSLLEGGSISMEGAGWKAAAALGVSLLAIAYIGRLASKAVAEYEAELEEADKPNS